MHSAAREFVARWSTGLPIAVIEVGSRDVNGTVRDLFPQANWIGIDIMDGPGVDIVCDAATYTPTELVDLVICCEVLEHTQNWSAILLNAAEWLKPGGRLILTCAGPGRMPHSAIDGCDLREGEYYRNLTTWELVEALEWTFLELDVVEYQSQHCDCRISGVRPS